MLAQGWTDPNNDLQQSLQNGSETCTDGHNIHSLIVRHIFDKFFLSCRLSTAKSRDGQLAGRPASKLLFYYNNITGNY